MATFSELQARLSKLEKRKTVYDELISHLFKHIKGGEMLMSDVGPVDKEVLEDVLEELDARLKPISAEIEEIRKTEVSDDRSGDSEQCDSTSEQEGEESEGEERPNKTVAKPIGARRRLRAKSRKSSG